MRNDLRNPIPGTPITVFAVLTAVFFLTVFCFSAGSFRRAAWVSNPAQKRSGGRPPAARRQEEHSSQAKAGDKGRAQSIAWAHLKNVVRFPTPSGPKKR